MSTKTSTYSVCLTELHLYDLSIVATSADDALKKAEAFYAELRKSRLRYEEDGIIAVLQDGSATLVSLGESPSCRS